MDTDEILKSLTTEQRAELDADIALFTKKTSAAFQKAPVAYGEVNTNVRLTGEIFLNVTLLLYNGDKGVVHPVIENIHKFDTMDEYLEALNKQTDRKNDVQKTR